MSDLDSRERNSKMENQNPSVDNGDNNAMDDGDCGREMEDGPPVDDCCPICFGSFSIACKSNCRHWFCAGCILQYWNYIAAPKPCKCPLCSCNISSLTPEASLLNRKDEEVTKVLENVLRYNGLFVGGARGIFRKVCESPLFVKRILRDMMDPDTPNYYLNEMRMFAMLLSVLYTASPFNFIPTGGVGIVRLFDYFAIAVVIIARLVGIYRRRRLTRRVRQLAATEL